MVQYARWSVILTLLVCALGGIYAAPNLFGEIRPGELPGWVPQKRVNLGLDLQGGSYLLLEVEADAVITEQLETVVSSARRVLRGQDVGYTGLGVDGNAVVFVLRDAAQETLARELMRDVAADMVISVDDGAFRVEMTEELLRARRQEAIEQSIEVVRRRVDETGVAEPSIQQQGADRIVVELPGEGDPERIKALLGKTAKLTFHMVDHTTTATDALRGQVPSGSMLLYQPGDQGAGQLPLVVRREVSVSGDRLTNAQLSYQDGRPVVAFTFDTAGARQFGAVTSENVNRSLAIVLDNEVISAPNIRQPILGGNGIITGGYTVQTATDLALLLRAGALPAPLNILEERTVGASLGADSIAAGKVASVVALVLVIVFMAVYYGLFGIMADLALLLNLVLIVAALSLLQATLTLPGIAGIVLTIGMAVDANVLIFERIREEVRAGRTPISAVDAGYRRALTTIVDSNVTTLIAALLLLLFGSGPIKGFAWTLAFGIASSMFTAIMVTRLMIVTWLRQKHRPQILPI